MATSWLRQQVVRDMTSPAVTGCGYTEGVPVMGRRKELEEVGRLLGRACHERRGGLLVIVGPAGSGKTLLAETAAAGARERGLQVLWARPATGQPGRFAWVSLLRDTGAQAKVMA